jgi:ADP-heptose:LPS heptosyltransferase
MWELPEEKFNLFITGSEKEHELFKTWIPELPRHITDLSGKMSMDELIAFVFNADGLLASGTGPLHLAAASGIHTLGLFPVKRSINAGRWAPLGRKAEHMESNGDDLSSISVDMVYKRIMEWQKK